MPAIIQTLLSDRHHRHTAHDLFSLELILKWAAQGCAHENHSALAADLMTWSRLIGAAGVSVMHAETRGRA
jgi:hypothetical protein